MKHISLTGSVKNQTTTYYMYELILKVYRFSLVINKTFIVRHNVMGDTKVTLRIWFSD